jgi:hypothetical protein
MRNAQPLTLPSPHVSNQHMYQTNTCITPTHVSNQHIYMCIRIFLYYREYTLITPPSKRKPIDTETNVQLKLYEGSKIEEKPLASNAPSLILLTLL